jgi:hypothetical protein
VSEQAKPTILGDVGHLLTPLVGTRV